MSKRLLVVNMVMLATAALFVALIVRTARTPWPTPEPVRPRPTPAAAAPASDPGGAAPAPPQAYAMVPARNLFSPTRTEAPPPPTAAAPAVVLPKPNLYGVVVREGMSVAYLEDPVTKRVGGYRLGDAIAGGTVKAITHDRVTLARPDGSIDVRLHDPSRPRPAPPAAAGAPVPPGAPAAPPRTASPLAPVPMPAGPETTPTPPTTDPAAGTRRVLPPGLLRRLAPPTPSNAPQQ